MTCVERFREVGSGPKVELCSQSYPRMPRCAILKAGMRDPEIIETDLMEISSIADDLVKFERIVAWCASHPDEVPFALHQLLKQKEKGPDQP